jgi:acetyl-CoA synthetase
MSNSIDSVLNETRVFAAADAFVAQANVSGMDSYKSLVLAAQNDYEGFWANLARENIA